MNIVYVFKIEVFEDQSISFEEFIYLINFVDEGFTRNYITIYLLFLLKNKDRWPSFSMRSVPSQREEV